MNDSIVLTLNYYLCIYKMQRPVSLSVFGDANLIIFLKVFVIKSKRAYTSSKLLPFPVPRYITLIKCINPENTSYDLTHTTIAVT